MEFTEAWEHTCSTVGLAAREGHFAKLKKLINQNMPVDVADNRGWRPLHEAAAVGKDLRCLEELLRRDQTDVNWQTHEGETALLLVCKRRKGDDALAATKILINSGADVNIVDNEHESALLIATRAGLNTTVQLLLGVQGIQTNIADYSNWTALHDASSHGYLEIVQFLIKAGAKLDVRDECGMTPIFTAAQKGKLDCLRLLLKTAQDRKMIQLVNSGAEDFATPLLIAAQQGFLDCVELLLSYGADPNIRTDDNATALHLAIQNKHSAVLQLLLNCMDIDEIKKCCVTHPSQPKVNMINPLHLAVEFASHTCLKLLLQAGFPVNSIFSRAHLPNEHLYVLILPRYETALSLAVAKGDLTAIKILLDAGADCNVPFQCVMRPITTLLLGDQNYNVDAIFELLIDKGAAVNYQSRGPATNCPIISALWNTKLLFRILSYGAKLELCFEGEHSMSIFIEAIFRVCQDPVNILNRLKIFLFFVDTRSECLMEAIRQIEARSEAMFVEHNSKAWESLMTMCNNVLPLLCICRIYIRRFLISTHKFSEIGNVIERLNLPLPLHSFLNYSDLQSYL